MSLSSSSAQSISICLRKFSSPVGKQIVDVSKYFLILLFASFVGCTKIIEPNSNRLADINASNGQALVHGHSFDPTEEDSTSCLQIDGTQQPALTLIQTERDLRTKVVEQLVARNIEIKKYFGDNVLLVKIRNPQELNNLEHIRFKGPMKANLKVAPDFSNIICDNDDTLLNHKVFLELIDPSAAPAAISAVKAVGAHVLRSFESTITASLNSSQLRQVLLSDDVVYAAPVRIRVPRMDKASRLVGTEFIWSNVLKETGYMGENQIVGVLDEEGFDASEKCSDERKCNQLNQAQVSEDFEEHDTSQLRVVGIAERDEESKSTSDLDGHGTLVSSIILGNGAISGRSEETPVVSGIAPKSKLAFVTENPNRDDAETLKLSSEDFHARIHNISNGTNEVEYGDGDFNLDKFLYAHQKNVIVIAAGNEGPKEKTVESPAHCKNCIAVGNAENEKPEAFIDKQQHAPFGSPGEYADKKFDINYSSSAGPSLIGTEGLERIKPDLTAPGSIVAAVRSSKIEEKFRKIIPVGSAIPPYIGSIEFTGSDPANRHPKLSAHYFYATGTSLSAPLVSGYAALCREFLTDISEKKSEEVDGPLIKALLLHDTLDMKQTEGDVKCKNSSTDWCPDRITNTNYPDFDQGWGFLNSFQTMKALKNSSSTKAFAPDFTLSDIPSTTVSASKRFEYEFYALRSGKLQITLAWYDQEVEGGNLMRPLKMTLMPVDMPNLPYYGGAKNMANGVSVSGTYTPDLVNNVQKIIIPNPPADGKYRLTIEPAILGTFTGNAKVSVIISGIAEVQSTNIVGSDQKTYYENSSKQRKKLETGPNSEVFFKAVGLPNNTDTDVYVIRHNPAYNYLKEGLVLTGLDVRNQPKGNPSTLKTSSEGMFTQKSLWSNPTRGRYNIIIDVNRNGVFEPGIDIVDKTNDVGFYVEPNVNWSLVTAGNTNGTTRPKARFRADGKDAIYAQGTGLPAHTMQLYIVKTPAAGMQSLYGASLLSIKANIKDNPQSVTPTANGLLEKVIWTPGSDLTLDEDFYTLVLDVDNDGVFSPDEDISDYVSLDSFFLLASTYDWNLPDIEVPCSLNKILNKWFESNLPVPFNKCTYDDNVRRQMLENFGSLTYLKEDVAKKLSDVSNIGFSIFKPESAATLYQMSEDEPVSVESWPLYSAAVLSETDSFIGFHDNVQIANSINKTDSLTLEPKASMLLNSHNFDIKGTVLLDGHLSLVAKSCSKGQLHNSKDDKNCVSMHPNSKIVVRAGGTAKILVHDELKNK